MQSAAAAAHAALASGYCSSSSNYVTLPGPAGGASARLRIRTGYAAHWQRIRNARTMDNGHNGTAVGQPSMVMQASNTWIAAAGKRALRTRASGAVDEI